MSAAVFTTSFSASLVAEVQQLIDLERSGELAPITALEDIAAKLTEVNACEEAVLTDVERVYCHPKNRSSTGVKAFNAHETGHVIVGAGVDPRELAKACVIQMSPIEAMRQQQVDFNAGLVETGAGMIAKPFGKEDVLSLGGGHLFTFLRAVKAKCRSHIEKLRDQNGLMLWEAVASRDMRMREALTQGIKCRRFSWQCEVAWPLFTDLVQRALNASHEAAQRMSELEVLLQIADYDAARQPGQTLEAVIQAVEKRNHACTPYVAACGNFILKCGGGSGAPYIRFLNRFAKRFAASKILGQEFVTSLSNLDFSMDNKLVVLRCGCMLVNLVCDKEHDGIARTLTRSDVERLKSQHASHGITNYCRCVPDVRLSVYTPWFQPFR